MSEIREIILVMKNNSKFDVAISDSYLTAAHACYEKLISGGLSPVILPVRNINDTEFPSYVLSTNISVNKDAHIVLLKADTSQAGINAAHEILAELFDDCEA